MVFGIAAGVVALAVALWVLIPPPAVGPQPENEAIGANAVASQVDLSESIRDTFALCANTGDEMLLDVPNPTEEEEFLRFMGAMANYEKALSLAKRYPELQLDSFGLSSKYDSLDDLREQRFERELEAASKFASVDQMEFANFRFNNAKVLGKGEDQSRLDAVARKIK